MPGEEEVPKTPTSMVDARATLSTSTQVRKLQDDGHNPDDKTRGMIQEVNKFVVMTENLNGQQVPQPKNVSGETFKDFPEVNKLREARIEREMMERGGLNLKVPTPTRKTQSTPGSELPSQSPKDVPFQAPTIDGGNRTDEGVKYPSTSLGAKTKLRKN